MFGIILFSVLRHGNKDAKEGKLKKLIKRATITFVLAIMFGVGWIFGVLGGTPISAIADPSQFIFVGVVAFQGLLIFILHPCRSKDAREEWKKWFYYVTCRPQVYQEKLKLSKVSHHSSGEHSTSSTATRRTLLSSQGAPTLRLPKQSSIDTITPPASRRGSSALVAKYGSRQSSPCPSIDSGAALMAAKFGYTGRRDSSSPRPSVDTGTLKPGSAASMAARFGFTGRRDSSDTVASRRASADSRSPLPAQRRLTGAAGMAARFGFTGKRDPSVDKRIPEGVSECSSPVTEKAALEKCYSGFSSGSTSPVTPLPVHKTPHKMQVSLFANSGELIDLGADDEFEYGSFDIFSEDSDPFMFANPHAQEDEGEEGDEQELAPSPTFDYDEELQSGTATIFYNFK